MKNDIQTYEYESEHGGKYLLAPKLGMYANNNNLSVQFFSYDETENFWEPFCSATTNIVSLAYLEAAIDTNDNGFKMLDFLEQNGFGQRTPFIVASGFCTYPIFKFNEQKLRQIDPKIFRDYKKAYRMDKPPLTKQIHMAQSQSETNLPSKNAPKCRVTFRRSGGHQFYIDMDMTPKDYDPQREGFSLDVDERIRAYDTAAGLVGEDMLSDYVIASAEMIFPKQKDVVASTKHTKTKRR